MISTHKIPLRLFKKVFRKTLYASTLLFSETRGFKEVQTFINWFPTFKKAFVDFLKEGSIYHLQKVLEICKSLSLKEKNLLTRNFLNFQNLLEDSLEDFPEEFENFWDTIAGKRNFRSLSEKFKKLFFFHKENKEAMKKFLHLRSKSKTRLVGKSSKKKSISFSVGEKIKDHEVEKFEVRIFLELSNGLDGGHYRHAARELKIFYSVEATVQNNVDAFMKWVKKVLPITLRHEMIHYLDESLKDLHYQGVEKKKKKFQGISEEENHALDEDEFFTYISDIVYNLKPSVRSKQDLKLLLTNPVVFFKEKKMEYNSFRFRVGVKKLILFASSLKKHDPKRYRLAMEILIEELT